MFRGQHQNSRNVQRLSNTKSSSTGGQAAAYRSYLQLLMAESVGSPLSGFPHVEITCTWAGGCGRKHRCRCPGGARWDHPIRTGASRAGHATHHAHTTHRHTVEQLEQPWEKQSSLKWSAMPTLMVMAATGSAGTKENVFCPAERSAAHTVQPINPRLLPLSCPTPGKTVPHHPLGDGCQVTVPHPPCATTLPPYTHIFRHRNCTAKRKEFNIRCVQRAANVLRPTP